MKTKLASIFLILILLSCKNNGAQDGQDSENDKLKWAEKLSCPEGFDKFSNEILAICYPNDWLRDNSGMFDSEVYLFSPVKDTFPDGRIFTQNINVMKQNESLLEPYKILNLDEFADFSKKQVEEVLYQAQILKFEKANLAGVNSYNCVMMANQNGFDLYFNQYLLKHNNHYIIITYTAPVDVSEASKEQAVKIMNTLKLN